MGALGRQRQFADLDDALLTFDIPVENHEFIRGVTARIGIVAYYGTSEYIKAIRDGDGPALNIARDATTGFASEDEARTAATTQTAVWPSDRGPDLWGITHPATADLPATAAAPAPRADSTPELPGRPELDAEPQPAVGSAPEPEPMSGTPPAQVIPAPRQASGPRLCPEHFLELSATGLCSSCE